MLRMSQVLLVSLIALTASSCARTVTLHPVDETDIRMDGQWVCMTPEYIQEVMKARLDK